MKAGVKPILGVEIYVAPGSMREKSGGPGDAANHLTLLARNEDGYRNLVQLTSAANIEGFYYKPRVDKAFLREHAAGTHRALRLPQGGGRPEDAPRGRRRRREGRARAAGDLRRGQLLPRAAGQRDPRAGAGERGPDRARAAHRPPARRDERLPLPAAGGRPGPRGARLHLRPARRSRSQDRMRLSTDQFYFRSPEEMARLFAAVPAGAARDGRDRRALQRRAQARRVPLPGGRGPGGRRRRPPSCAASPPPASRRASAPALDPERRRAYDERLAYELGVIEKMDFPSYFLAVWDFVHYAKTQRHPGRPGPRLGGGQPRGLGARHHRPRPAALRPALRALPQPRAQEHARHRRRLRAEPPRRGDRLRAAQVRRGPGRADRHLRQAQGQGGDPRRRPRARDAVRRGRQDLQARPGRPEDDAQEGARGGAAPRRAARQGPAGRPPARDRRVARGAQPPRLDARLRGAHLAGAAREPRAALQGPEEGRAPDAVRHGGDPGDRPGQVRLPRPDHADRASRTRCG